jgi:light-regulated signal transduction histidine kinase (bacteriophytochrome)
VKKIIERHGGRLDIDSMLGRGTTISMVVPIKAQRHPEDNLLNESLKAEASGSSRASVEATPVRNRVAERFDADAGRRGEQP